MSNSISVPNRRECLKLGAAVSLSALLPSAAFAQGKPSEIAVRFQVAVQGKKFGVKLVQLKNGTNMISLRELGGNRRHAFTFNYDKLPKVNSVNLKISGKTYQVSRKGDWLTTNIPGVAIGYPEAPARSADAKPGEPESGEAKPAEAAVESNENAEVPDELKHESRGFFAWLKSVASSVWEGVKGAVQAVASVIGAIYTLVFGGGVAVVNIVPFEIEIDIRDKDEWKVHLGSASGAQFMPPPPGTPIDPGTWY